jgi:hypothetical protein
MVVEAAVESLEGLRVVKPKDGSSEQGEDLASAGFLARSRGVFFPKAVVAFPVVFVFHGPVAPDGLRQPGGASLIPLKAGDEVAGLAFELIAFPLHPFAGDFHKLPCAGKQADLPVEVNPCDVAAFDPPVVLFPIADPLVGKIAEAPLGKLVKGGLVVLES